ncbi:MAG: AraC family transcriptional regulator [Inhella sp.]|jgi:AraC-like DNA-binding protein|uniref:AraC family transcriptional regulator n=1 Tax=Inhella sp. TaxID=1921806 RepID=UPI0022C659E3|nr:AraC family transcriptional regulator [Inhella sp.]MCZ8233864.1 AraC family transcriptional regulator [Inhella sp.]
MATTIGMHAAPRAAESAAHDADRSPRAVLIAQVLDSLRFHGWFFCVSELSAPWALQLPGGRLAAIHAVLEGECVVTLAGDGTTLHLSAGDVVVLPRDEVHAMSDRAGRPVVAVTAIAGIDRRDRRASSLSYGGGGALTRLLTASFTAEMRSAQAIVAGLPAIMVLRAATPECKRLSPALALVREEAAQPGGVSSAVLRRTAEILFVQALREALLDTRPATGWLAAASDSRLAPALLALHEQPERRWTLVELAHCTHLSRTAFLERFQACLGQTPTEYLQGWRLQLAAQRLRETQDSVTQIAMSVGYDNPSAFARAFKRLLGQSPNEFRAARPAV